MGHIGHVVARDRGHGAGIELQAKPHPQHDPRRYRKNAKEDHEDEQHINARPGKQQKVAAHHSGDRPRRAHHRRGLARVDGDLQHSRAETGGEVEQKIADMAHLIFEVIAKDPQEQHVAKNMHPAAVQEHRGDQRAPTLTGHDPFGHHAPDIDEQPAGIFVGQRQPIAQKHRDIDRNQAEVDIGGAAGWIVIADRKHRRRISDPNGFVKRCRFRPEAARCPLTPWYQCRRGVPKARDRGPASR